VRGGLRSHRVVPLWWCRQRELSHSPRAGLGVEAGILGYGQRSPARGQPHRCRLRVGCPSVVAGAVRGRTDGAGTPAWRTRAAMGRAVGGWGSSPNKPPLGRVVAPLGRAPTERLGRHRAKRGPPPRIGDGDHDLPGARDLEHDAVDGWTAGRDLDEVTYGRGIHAGEPTRSPSAPGVSGSSRRGWRLVHGLVRAHVQHGFGRTATGAPSRSWRIANVCSRRVNTLWSSSTTVSRSPRTSIAPPSANVMRHAPIRHTLEETPPNRGPPPTDALPRRAARGPWALGRDSRLAHDEVLQPAAHDVIREVSHRLGRHTLCVAVSRR
jgi:hypothetical protein